MLLGRGPGSVVRDADFFNRDDVPSNYPALAKVAAEYGFPAAILFVVFVLTVFFSGVPSPTLAFAAVITYFGLSSALLQPTVVYVCWLVTGLFAAERFSEISHRTPASKESPPRTAVLDFSRL